MSKGLTSIFYHLDISINRSFKEAINHEYEYACIIFKSSNKKKINRETLINWNKGIRE